MKLSHFICILILFDFLLSCKAKMDMEVEKTNPLEGTTWELTSGKWSREDTTFTFPGSPYDQCIMIFGKTHAAYVNQDTSRKVFSVISGSYGVNKDNLTITIKMCRSYEDIGRSVNWKFKIEDDQLILNAKGYHFRGYDWKSDQVWKRID